MNAPLKSIITDFDLTTGLSESRPSIKRRLSDMKGMFSDQKAYEAECQRDNRLVYEYFDMGVPHTEKDVAYGTSIVYPGKIGAEYHMTKGHFHTVLDTTEVYYCLRGHGYLMMENPEGEVEARELKPGLALYVPKRYAHRSINVSATEQLITFFAFPAMRAMTTERSSPRASARSSWKGMAVLRSSTIPAGPEVPESCA